MRPWTWSGRQTKQAEPWASVSQNRYNYTSQHVKSLLDSGSLGKVLGAKALVTWGRDAKYYGQAQWRGTWQYEGGGVLINQAIHTLDLLQWFLGLPVSVAAQMSCYQLQDWHRG